MPDQKEQALQAMEIAPALRSNEIRQHAACLIRTTAAKQLLLAGVALLAAQPGSLSALTIGELQVRSSLGQPLVATAIARLAPGEVLAPGCVGAVAGTPGGNASLVTLSTEVAQTAAPGEYPVRITSAARLHEPMYEIQLKVSCPGIMALAKNYVVMLDLGAAMPDSQPVAVPATETGTLPEQMQPVAVLATGANNQVIPAIAPEQSVQAPDQPTPGNRNSSAGAEVIAAGMTAVPAHTAAASIAAGGSYRVQASDTLLTIAQRIEDRAGLSTRQFARLLLQENPSAFIGGNPDLIKLGFVITIPRGPALSIASEDLAQAQPYPAASSTGTVTSSTAAATGERTVLSAVGPAEKPVPAASDAAEPAQVAAEESIPAATSEPDIADNGTENITENTVENSAEISAPVTDLPAARTADATADNQPPVTQQTAPAVVASTAITTPAKPNKLVATASGILVGTILAALFLGRGFIMAWLPGPLRRERQPESQPDSAQAGFKADFVGEDCSAATADELAAQTATASQDEQGLVDSYTTMPRSPGRDIGVEAAEAAIEAALAKAAATESAVLANESAPATADLSTTDLDAGPANNAPRISLHDSAAAGSAVDFDLNDMEEPLENTRRYSNPSMLAADNSAAKAEPAKPYEPDGSSTMRGLFGIPGSADPDLDITGTMHDIFGNTPAGLSDCAETEEIPDLRSRLGDNSFARIDIDNTSSLQALSESVLNGGADDELSKTLTQALGLLQQDYEDELTNSQLLDQKEIRKAFAEQAAKDD